MIRTWSLGILCVFLTAFFVGYTINEQKKDAFKDARTYMINIVHFMNMDIERSLYGIDQTFKGLQNYLHAFEKHGATFLEEDLRNALDFHVTETPFITSLLILNAEGETKFWSGQRNRPNLKHTDYFSIHKTYTLNNLYIGRPVAVQDHSGWIFGVSKGVRDQQGKLQSVMVAMMDITFLKNRYKDIQLLPGTILNISSLDDFIYLQLPNHKSYVGRYVPGLNNDLRTSSKTFLFQTNKESHSLSAKRKISGYPLVVSVTESEETILSSWRKNSRHFQLLGMAAAMVILFMTFQVASYQRKQHLIKEELRSQASTDALTGLTNRRYALEQAALEIKKAKRSNAPLSFIIMDLDHFKEVNDNFGHSAGDLVLKETSVILQKLCRETDIVSRYGGEEFLLVLPNTDIKGAMIDAERIRQSLERTSHWADRKQFIVTASFGVSQWIENEELSEGAIRRADDALYKAKNKGRNSILCLQNTNVTSIANRLQKKKTI